VGWRSRSVHLPAHQNWACGRSPVTTLKKN